MSVAGRSLYDYHRVWFNKRATYLLQIGSIGATGIIGVLTGYVSNPVAKAAVFAARIGTTAISIKALNAQNDGQCFAFSFYTRKAKYRYINLPGPEVAPRSVYQTSTNCTGKYSAS